MRTTILEPTERKQLRIRLRYSRKALSDFCGLTEHQIKRLETDDDYSYDDSELSEIYDTAIQYLECRNDENDY